MSEYGEFMSMTVLPSKNLSPLWLGRKNEKKLLSAVRDDLFATLEGLRKWASSSKVNLPSHNKAKKLVRSCMTKRRSSWR